MRRIIITVAALSAMGGIAHAQYPSGQQVMRDALARAQAEKARNDDIVRQQRMREQQRRQQEEQSRRLEEAQRRARTG